MNALSWVVFLSVVVAMLLLVVGGFTILVVEGESSGNGAGCSDLAPCPSSRSSP